MADGGDFSGLPIPADLDVDNARLPAVYQAAQTALAECYALDECQAWADKAEALASYARQSQDDTLRRLCDRIQGRAVRRAGEILEEIKPARGGDRGNAATGGRPPIGETRERAATDAGLSEHQRKTALRVAAVPKEEFEAAIEAHEPATVTQLAELGKRPRAGPIIDHLQGRDPADFQQATALIGAIRRADREAAEIDIARALRGLAPDDVPDLAERIGRVRKWLDHIQGGINAV